MGQHVKAGVRDQALGQGLEQIAVQDRHIRAELFVHQRVLDLVMGQYGKVRHLRSGAGGGGNGRHLIVPLGKIRHGLGTVHGAAAPQSDDEIRAKGADLRRPLRRQLHRWVGLHPVKEFRLHTLGGIRHLFRRSVFHKEGVRHHQHPAGPQAPQGLNGPAAANKLCLTGVFLQHLSTTAFSFPRIPGSA